MVNRAQGLATVSEYTEAIVRKNLEVGSLPLRVIPHGVEWSEQEEQKPKGPLPTGPFLFSIGTFFERKNFHVLLPLIERMEGYSLVLAGNYHRPYGDRIREEIRSRNLVDRVFLPGEVSTAEKTWLYAHCEAFVFPSISEGFGIPVIEAMRAGKPVFCSTHGSLPEVGGENAFYWKDFDPDSMKSVFLEGMVQSRSHPEWKERSLAHAQSFTWGRAAESYLSYYSELLQ
jgi:glycosyltransferase involved in cell wall biosynthesis